MILFLPSRLAGRLGSNHIAGQVIDHLISCQQFSFSKKEKQERYFIQEFPH